MKWIRKLVGRKRWLYRFCPSCNSDAPAIDKCPVCKGCRDVANTLHPLDQQRVWDRFVDEGCILR